MADLRRSVRNRSAVLPSRGSFRRSLYRISTARNPSDAKGSKGSSSSARWQLKNSVYRFNTDSAWVAELPVPPSFNLNSSTLHRVSGINAIPWNSKYYGVLQRGRERRVSPLPPRRIWIAAPWPRTLRLFLQICRKPNPTPLRFRWIH